MTVIVPDNFGVLHNRQLDREAHVRIALSIFVPLVGTLSAVIDLPTTAMTTTTAIVFAVFFVGTTLGINLGLHRYFSHASFKTSRAFRLIIATFASFAMQGPIAVWVADHRRHHRFTDGPGDPHSPYWIGGTAAPSRVSGFWHAHFQWMFQSGITDVCRYAPDVLADPISGWQSRNYLFMCVLALASPAAVGFVLGGPHEALRCFLWAGCAKVTVLHEVTRAVNSYGHMFGSKDARSRNESRNNRWAFWLWLGEGLHGFHHLYPSAAVMEPKLFDPVGLSLLGFQKLGLVWQVRRARAWDDSNDSGSGRTFSDGGEA